MPPRSVRLLLSSAFILLTAYRSPFSPIPLDGRFEFDADVAVARLVEGFEQAERLVEDAALVLGPVRLARDAARLAAVVGRARRLDALDDLALDGEHHRR